MKNCVKIITIFLVLIILLPTSNLNAATPVLLGEDDYIVFLPMVNRGQALPPEDESSQYITLPDRFEVRIFAQNLPTNPRMMAFGPDDQLYVSLMYSGQIARLPDQNRDGLADKVEIVVDGLDYPQGIEFYNDGLDDWLYVAQGNKVERFKYQDDDGDFVRDLYFLIPLPAPGLNYTRTLHFGPDGNLYISVGSSCNACVETNPRYGTILRFTPEGDIPASNPFYNPGNLTTLPRWSIWAEGLRNSVDFVWVEDELWTNQNGSDNLSDTLPPEEVVIAVQPGESHGWPFCYTNDLGVVINNEIRDSFNPIPLPSQWNCDDAIPALFTTQAHASPLGMALGESWIFPQEYQDSLYISYSGSWDNIETASHPDCKIERILLEDGQPASEEAFALFYREEGKECGAYGTWGRPVDIIFGQHGDMYISDDIGMRIYRVIYIP